MTFWIVSGALAVLLSAALVRALLAGKRETGPAEAFDLDVYRDQLREVDADAARGKIDAEEAERLRVEISRRLLAADAKVQGGAQEVDQPKAASGAMAAIVSVLLIGGGIGLYLYMGQPSYGDMPLKQRMAVAQENLENLPSQAEIEATAPAVPPADAPQEYLDLVQKLRDTVAERPNDIQGHLLLSRQETNLGNFSAAAKLQARINELKGDQVTGQDYADLADLYVLATNGRISEEARVALEEALSRDPQNGVARFYGGLLMAQTGRPDIGFQMWDRLLRESAPDAPWVPAIRDRIEGLAMLAGQDRYQLPPLQEALPGPSASDMQNAAEMTPEERQQMVQGMVDQLSERLATQGGSAQEWARLIAALGVLGQSERAASIFEEAQGVFGADPQAMALLQQAAGQAGISAGAGAATPPAALPGPSAEDMRNAAEMSPEDRAEMIAGMVAQLSERLASEGGTPEEWARLINVMAVQGNMDGAAQALADAEAAYGTDEAAMEVIRGAAERAGVVE
jgi:cytochrome c-type biogenesis protein CcmH